MRKTETKQEIFDLLNSKGLVSTKKEASEIYDTLMDFLHSELLKKQEVSLSSIGKLTLVQRKERKARNVREGKSITVPETTVVKLKVSKNFKQEVAKKKLAK